ncbi:MAG: ATP-binding protein [Candidatus Aenigmarchaeota archaeon]|nr:ATP-binding protein [Candidatus Aenigmarchaeota archaeon]
MAKTIGTVISNLDGPSTFRFDFVIKEDSGGIPAHKGQFIQVKTEEGLLIGRVDEIMKTNRYFMQAESVREFEKTGSPLNEMFPVDRWEYLVAKITPLGIYDSGLLKRVTYPPSPGVQVEEIDKKILTEFLGLDSNGLNIGKISFHDLDVKINLTKMFQKHLAILAMSGAGKSYLTSVMFEELLDRMDDLGKPSVIVIDPHGEYTGFAKDPEYGSKTKVYGKDDICIGISNLSPYQIMEFLPGMSPAQRRELTTIIQGMVKKKKPYTFKDLITEIEVSSTKRVIKDTMISWLMHLENSKLFKNSTKPDIKDLAKPGQLSIMDISDIVSQRDKQMLVTFFARKLFWMRTIGKIPPFILVVEEAHQFCPEGVRKEGALSRSIIETIAREGRKFHASLVLISQRPIQLSTTALSQCNTHIIMRVTNPYDLDHMGKSSEGVTNDVLKMIPGLRIGEALIVGEAVNYPLLIKVRGRKSKKSDKGINFEDALLNYNKSFKKKDEDMEAFM